MGGCGVGHRVGGWVVGGVVGVVGVMGGWGGGVGGPHDTPIMGDIRCPICYFLTIW